MARWSAMDLALKHSLEQILLDLQPDQVPIAYLEQAIVEMKDGSIKVYDRKAYKRLLNTINKNPNKKSQIISTRVIFNIDNAKMDIKNITNKLFANFNLEKFSTEKSAKSKKKVTNKQNHNNKISMVSSCEKNKLKKP